MVNYMIHRIDQLIVDTKSCQFPRTVITRRWISGICFTEDSHQTDDTADHVSEAEDTHEEPSLDNSSPN